MLYATLIESAFLNYLFRSFYRDWFAFEDRLSPPFQRHYLAFD